MRKHPLQNWINLASLILFFSLFGCENKTATAPEFSDQQFANAGQHLSAANTTNGETISTGPISNEQATSLQAPEKKVTRTESELKIVKAFSPEVMQKRFVKSWWVTQKRGGWIYAGDDWHGTTWLFFPRFALSSDAVITIDWESTGLLEGGVEFSPHGIKFALPVPIWISYKDVDLKGVDEKDLKIWYYNEDTGLWELIGDAVDVRNKMVGGILHHFSRYALGAE